MSTGWCLKIHIFYFHPKPWGRWTHFDDHNFSYGLKPPTRKTIPRWIHPCWWFRHPVNSPVEGKVVNIPLFTRFQKHPMGWWKTTNSSTSPRITPSHNLPGVAQSFAFKTSQADSETRTSRSGPRGWSLWKKTRFFLPAIEMGFIDSGPNSGCFVFSFKLFVVVVVSQRSYFWVLL